MSLRSTYTRIGITLAAGSLVALAAATPALADGDGGSGSGGTQEWSNGGGDGGTGQTWTNGGTGGDGAQQGTGGGGDGSTGQTWNNGGGGDGGTGQTWNNGGGGDGREPATGNNNQNNPRLYRGRITARDGLALRSAPTRGSQLIRVARYGETVSIYCKTSGQNVQGNPLWYLLTDGTWAWGAARYIDNIGPSPRWC
ncbi:SH3 domain-containing protein [Streptomyces sp. NPDC002688]|uniref:SH3 domain-containing protein n=1 Tax=Streptomyces sp. NPDC002688 TaxID=3154423 RepID=UPI003320012A